MVTIKLDFCLMNSKGEIAALCEENTTIRDKYKQDCAKRGPLSGLLVAIFTH